MTRELKDLVKAVVDAHIGMREALAVIIAIEVAEQRWSEEDTVQYGTYLRDWVTEKEASCGTS